MTTITTPSRITVAGLACAVLAVFGVLGVVAGMVAVGKGAHWRGALVVSLSAIGSVVGYYWGSVV
ncbi:MAG: hypothetical protein HQ475_05925 [SAR202 cluster bacterium]|nr:hypothetical protein [SAR202 cluster bacterium]